MANDSLRGRQVVLRLTNKSGGGVVEGDVVILSSGTAAAFTTTTSAALATDMIGVALETIANDGLGRVCFVGYVPKINLSAAASLGDTFATHTVAKQAAPAGSRATGHFGQVLGTGATPAAYVWGVPDGAGGGDVSTDGIWDAAGDIVQGTGSNTAARLAIGTAGQILRVNSGATAIEYKTIWPNNLLTAPVAGDFSWFNQGTATIATQNGGEYLYAAAASGSNLKIREMNAPASTPYTVTAGVIVSTIAVNYVKAGIIFRQSSDDKSVVCAINWGGSQKYNVDKYTNSTTYTATYVSLDAFLAPAIYFFRITDTGTDRVSYISNDGANFIQIHTVGRTDFCTADKIGFFVESNNSTYPIGALFVHWAVT